MFNINDLASNINRYGGLAKPSRFSVMITPPAWSVGQDETRLIEFFCDSASLPGITFATSDVKNLGYGPTFKLPHTPIYSDMDVNVMCDNNGVVIGFFQKWMQNIINVNSEGDPSTSGYNGAKMYGVQYPSNYTTTISIMLYDAQEGTIIVYTLNEAYPLRIGQPNLDWNATNQVLRLPITFTYRTWTSTLFAANDQTLTNSVSSFNPFASTISGSLFNTSTYSYMSISDALAATAISLINNSGNYSSNLLNIFT